MRRTPARRYRPSRTRFGDIAPGTHAAIDENGRLVGRRVIKRRVQVGRDGPHARRSPQPHRAPARTRFRRPHPVGRWPAARLRAACRLGRPPKAARRYSPSAAATPWPTGTGVTRQQQQARARRDRAGGAGQRQAGLRRPAQGGGEPAGVFDQVHGDARRVRRRPAIAASRPGRPVGSPSNGGISSSTGQCHRYHEYDIRPIARIAGRHSTATDSHAAGDATAADHQHGAEHGQQRRCPGVGGAAGRVGCRSAGSVPALPTRRPPRATAVAGATAGSKGPPVRRRPAPRPGWAARRTPRRGAMCWSKPRPPPVKPPRPTPRPPQTAPDAARFLRARRTSHAVPMISTGHTR